MMIIWPVIYIQCEKTIYGMLMDEMTRGVNSTYSLDMFGVITASHFSSIFSQTVGTYFLYLLPLYVFFKLGGWFLSWLKQRSAEATTEEAD